MSTKKNAATRATAAPAAVAAPTLTPALAPADPQSFAGSLEPSKSFATPGAEMQYYQGGRYSTPDYQVIGRHLDDLYARADLSRAPDLELTIAGTGAIKAFPHALKDTAGNPVAPRLVRLLEWDAPTYFAKGIITSTSIEVNATNGANLKLGLYR